MNFVFIWAIDVLIAYFNYTEISIGGSEIRLVSSAWNLIVLIWSIKGIFFSIVQCFFSVFDAVQLTWNTLYRWFFFDNFSLEGSPLLYLSSVYIVEDYLLFDCLDDLFEHFLRFSVFT